MAEIVIHESGALSIGRLTIPNDELVVRASTSGGPGGQHANRTLSRITATFDVKSSSALSESQRELLLLNLGDVVSVSVATHRSQAKNRIEALETLAARLQRGLVRPKVRRATKPTKASQRRRLDAKRVTSTKKVDRRKVQRDD